MRRRDVLKIGSRTLGRGTLPTTSAGRLMDVQEVLVGEFTADPAKFKVTGGGFQDLGNGAKWNTRSLMGKQKCQLNTFTHPRYRD